MARVFLTRLDDGYRPAIEAAMIGVGFSAKVRRGDHVFLKPNLTFPTFRKGVMTNPDCIEHVVAACVDLGLRVTIGEADSGGYNRFSMNEVFNAIGLHDIARRYGATLVNMSELEATELRVRARGRRLSVPIPQLLRSGIDHFITLPVPKIHMNTIVSMCIKNQWGCIREPSVRLKLHPYFKHVILAVNECLPSRFAFIDGRYGLNGSGPMRGEVVDLGWLLGSDDLGAADATCVKLMGLDIAQIEYLRFARSRGFIPADDRIETNVPITDFVGPRFYLKRAWTDYPGLVTFNSTMMAYLGYRSPLAASLHKLLYKFREPFY